METVALRRALLSYYRRHGRDLPWRKTRDPYAIWVSEIMLQQTQVQTVVPRFGQFLRQFPSVAALASANETTICEAWAGLGYYRRARNLHKAALQIVSDHGGEMPRTALSLITLAGIGSYTASAIASIAFGERVAAVDGNLVRVLARVFALPGAASDARLHRTVRERAQKLVDCQRPGEVNQALMDIGATVCRPNSPRCEDCPLSKHCVARHQEDPALYPGRSVRADRPRLRIVFAWIESDGGILLQQRPLEGLWAGLWELPSAEGATARGDLARRLGLGLGRRIATVKHDLTHRRVEASVYLVDSSKGSSLKLGRVWQEPLSAPLSALARKAIVAARLHSRGIDREKRRNGAGRLMNLR